MNPSIGLSDGERRGAVEILSALLADEYVLYTKTRNYHWNVAGPQFNDLHKFFESQYIQVLSWHGRDVGLRARLLYKTEDLRADFISQAAKDVSVVIANGTKTITLDFNGNNRINGLGRSLSLDDHFYLDVTLVGTLSVADGIDMTHTVV